MPESEMFRTVKLFYDILRRHIVHDTEEVYSRRNATHFVSTAYLSLYERSFFRNCFTANETRGVSHI